MATHRYFARAVETLTAAWHPDRTRYRPPGVMLFGRSRWLAFVVLAVTSCVPSPRFTVAGDLGGTGFQTGVASFYGPGYHGRTTASGERFDQHALTAAHLTLPFRTRVLVTNLENHKSVTVTITDRGPYIDGRIIDLSVGAAERLDMIESGTATVRLDLLSSPSGLP